METQAIPVVGQSILPLLLDRKAQWTVEDSFSQRRPADERRIKEGWLPGDVYATRSIDRKVIINTEGSCEYYDLGADPFENNNVCDPSKADVAELLRLLADTYKAMQNQGEAMHSGAASPEVIEELKHYLMYGLTLYSALLETNSYHIEVNDHLVIARFVGLKDGFEVKLYTLRAEDLPARYEDKIYLGRDVVRLDRLDRDHFGLREMRRALREQNVKLRRRLGEHAPERMLRKLEKDYLGDLQELVEDFSSRAGEILKEFPPAFPGDELDWRVLLEMNRHFRELKHRLVETDALLQDMEKALVDKARAAARYVTKFRKDVTNDVNYIMLKVNGRITDAVNGIRL